MRITAQVLVEAALHGLEGQRQRIESRGRLSARTPVLRADRPDYTEGKGDRMNSLRCSFCQEAQGDNRKLIASPGGRAYICYECVAVCIAIVEEDREPLSPEPPDEPSPLLSHALASRLLTSVERWIKREFVGADAANEFAEMRNIAVRMFGTGGG